MYLLAGIHGLNGGRYRLHTSRYTGVAKAYGPRLTSVAGVTVICLRRLASLMAHKTLRHIAQPSVFCVYHVSLDSDPRGRCHNLLGVEGASPYA